MGELEKIAKTRRRKENIQKAALSMIGVAGILSIGAVAPGIVAALPHLMGRKRYRLAFQTKNAVGRLIVKGYVKKNEQGLLRITSEGRRHLTLEEARATAAASKKRRWDHRYRLVIFDIPQTRKGVRDRLRSLMREFGFLRLQNSVWVSPYDCEELVALMKAELRIGKDVLYVIADQIENDGWVKAHFKLN